MSHDNSYKPTKHLRLVAGGLLLIVAAAAVVTRGAWWPDKLSTVNSALAPEEDVRDNPAGHDDHDDHADHNEAASIELSDKEGKTSARSVPPHWQASNPTIRRVLGIGLGPCQ